MLIGSLRSDHYECFQNDADLFAAAEVVDVPPMTRGEIEAVIREPAAALGVRCAPPRRSRRWPRLPRQRRGLPLLSYLLSAAWERMQADTASKGVLQLPTAEIDIGRPVVEHAERFLELNATRAELLRRLFTLWLVHVSKKGPPMRRRAVERECSQDEWRRAQALSGPEWRLLTATEEAGEPAMEAAHEALLCQGMPGAVHSPRHRRDVPASFRIGMTIVTAGHLARGCFRDVRPRNPFASACPATG